MHRDELFSVAGKTSFVTGGAGGLGLAMAEILAVNGASVTIADIDAEALTRETSRFAERGLKVFSRQLNVKDSEDLETAISETAQRDGRLDICIANAGGSAGPGFGLGMGIEDYSLEAWQAGLDLNLTSAFVTLRGSARLMKKQKWGRIILIASGAAIRARPVVGYGYVAGKSGLLNVVRQAAVEMAPYGTTVNAIAPGPFKTNIGGGKLNDPEMVKKFTAFVPMGRLAEPWEIQGLALLLASNASNFITGETISIDGGSAA
jgi:NAD(P)-dependent dehydrogenase (short-subunit alcohol dehydrogenase family)